jgi:DNA-binding NarL/FixJ family response regulator
VNLKLLLIDEYPLFSYGIKSLIESKSIIKVVNIVHTKKEGILLTKKLQPDIIIVNIDHQICSEGNNQIDYLKLLSKSHIHGKIVVITKREFFQLFFTELIEQNVKGFLTRTTDANSIVEMFHSIINGQIVFSKELSQQLHCRTFTKLTNKEIKILQLIYNEKTNKEISKILNYSISTVEYYLTNIFTKLSVRSRVGAIREANNMGIL